MSPEIIARGEIYVSIDIEADGAIPGKSSMINFGAAFYDNSGTPLNIEYEANLEPLPYPAKPDPDTSMWWEKQFQKNPKLKEHLNTNVRDPGIVMHEFVNLSNRVACQYSTQLTPIAYPAGFDWMWMYWYLTYFTTKSPYSFSCLDIKSYAAAKMKCDYRWAVKRNMPKTWFNKNLKHDHSGLADCRGQAALFFSMQNV